MNKKVQWNGSTQPEAINILTNPGHLIVCPTKVGYIIMATDIRGLERKFQAKNRNLNKPAVVLCGSMEPLRELAELNEEIEAFYQKHWNDDILLGCILPWKKTSEKYIPQDGTRNMVMDKRNTSCFVIKFGKPSENIVRELWEKQGKLTFASSANPSGKGNRGQVEGIGEKIENEVDLIIEANDYGSSIQPDKNEQTRYEQGVMVSMVDDNGNLIPLQNQARGISPTPILIRKGLSVDKIVMNLVKSFPSWDYRHGQYY